MNMTKIEDFAEDWLATKSLKTAVSYRNTLKQFVANVCSDFEDIKLGNIFRWLDNSDMADTTRNKHINILKSFFSDMVLLETCPMTRSPFPRRHRKYPDDHKRAERILSQDEVTQLIGQARRFRDRVMFETLYLAGLRVSELTSLKWRNCIRMDTVDKLVIKGKGGHVRHVPVPKALMNAIFTLQLPEATDDDLVFPSRSGKSLAASDIRYLLRQAAKRAGLRQANQISPHWLRHANASHALANGAPINVVQKTLGHKSLDTTSKYLHIDLSESSAAYLNINQV